LERSVVVLVQLVAIVVVLLVVQPPVVVPRAIPATVGAALAWHCSALVEH